VRERLGMELEVPPGVFSRDMLVQDTWGYERNGFACVAEVCLPGDYRAALYEWRV